MKSSRVYVQIKTRIGTLGPADIAGALERFDLIRQEHVGGKRSGVATFVIIANAPPSRALAGQIEETTWPGDVDLYWPGGPTSAHD